MAVQRLYWEVRTPSNCATPETSQVDSIRTAIGVWKALKAVTEDLGKPVAIWKVWTGRKSPSKLPERLEQISGNFLTRNCNLFHIDMHHCKLLTDHFRFFRSNFTLSTLDSTLVHPLAFHFHRSAHTAIRFASYTYYILCVLPFMFSYIIFFLLNDAEILFFFNRQQHVD